MEWPQINMVMIPKEEWEEFKLIQSEILRRLKDHKDQNGSSFPVNHITAKEFMEAIRTKRTNFDQLVQANKIKITRKSRKIYVPVSEIDRYFNDNTVR